MTVLLLSSCATTPPNPTSPRDPLEHFNRDVTRFNTKIDDALIKPIAQGYKGVLPYQVRQSVTNFYNNLFEIANVAEDLFQGDGEWAMSDGWRFVINTTVGIGGLFDPASHIDLPAHQNDFGLTLNRWHIYTPYLVLPFYGPNSIGSAFAIPIDYYMGVQPYFVPLDYNAALTVLYGINIRARFLDSEKSASGLILDRYTFYRSAYLQRQAYLLSLNKAGPQFDAFPSAPESDSADAAEPQNPPTP